MSKSTNNIKTFIGCCLILLQLSDSWCQDLSQSVVGIYSNGHRICSGTLIKDNFVLTAARCLRKRTGASLLSVKGLAHKDEPNPETFVSKSHVSPKYRKNLHMDVAVLELIKPLGGTYMKPAAELCHENVTSSGDSVTAYTWKHFNGTKSSFIITTMELNVTDGSYKSNLVDTVFYTEGPKGIDLSESVGTPAAMNGQVCGIFISGPVACQRAGLAKGLFGLQKYNNNKPRLRIFTSVANPQVKKFIEDSLSK